MATLVDKIKLEINGIQSNDYIILKYELIQELLKPNELRFTMEKNSVLVSENDCSFDIPKKLLGAKVKFEITTKRFIQNVAQTNDELVFEGIIFDVEVYRKEMTRKQLIDVLVYSPDYVLMDHPHCRSYTNQTLSDIVFSIFEDCPSSLVVSQHYEGMIPYTVQYNETNYQFLVRLAQRYGQWMCYDGDCFRFVHRLDDMKTLELYPKMDIQNYRYKTGLRHHSVIHGESNYSEIAEKPNRTLSNKDLSKLEGEGFHGLTDKAWEISESLLKQKTFQHLQGSNPEASMIDDLEVSLNAQLFGEKAEQTICTGETIRADLKLGNSIIIKDIFDIDGNKTGLQNHERLIICRLVHTVDRKGNYRNQFMAISANSPYPPYYNYNAYPKSEPQKAKVIDNDDPHIFGHVQVQFLWQEEQDKSMVSPWIRVAHPHAGFNKGFYFIPEIGEEVMVGFENGNAERPFVIGALYANAQCPGVSWPAGVPDYPHQTTNDIKGIRTRNGHTIEFHDKGEGEGGFMKIFDNKTNNYVLTFSTDFKEIKLYSKGNIMLWADNDIQVKACHNILLSADNDIELEAENDIILKAKHNLVQQAKNERVSQISYGDTLTGGSVTIKATGGDINMTASANILGMSGSNMALVSSGKFDIEGSPVNIEGDPVNISGSEVNIN